MKSASSSWRFRAVVMDLLFVALFALPLNEVMAGPFAPGLSLGTLTLTRVSPRIFTPNGDGANDKAAFHFDNPELLPVQGEVFDLSGSRVAALKPGADPALLLLWDGKDAEGRTVAGGIYLYQIEFQGKLLTGTVVVAR